MSEDPTELPGTKPAMELSGIEPESYLEVLTYKAHERARSGSVPVHFFHQDSGQGFERGQ